MHKHVFFLTKSRVHTRLHAVCVNQATNKVYSAKVDGELTVTWSVKDPRALDHGAEIFWQVRHSIPAPRAYEPI